MADDIELVPGEELKKKLRPHPLAFLGMYFRGVYFVLVAIVVMIIGGLGFWQGIGGDNAVLNMNWSLILAMVVVVILSSLYGILTWYFQLERAGFWWMVWMIGGGIAEAAAMYGWAFLNEEAALEPDAAVGAGLFAIIAGLLLLIATWFLVENYRRAFRYYITSHAITFQRKFLSIDDRRIQYSKISDVQVQMTLLGRMFDFGNVTPVTASGIGTGTDESEIRFGVGHKAMGEAEVSAGVSGHKSHKKIRASPSDSIFGVRRPREIKQVIIGEQHEHTDVKQLDDIKQILKQQAEMMSDKEDADSS